MKQLFMGVIIALSTLGDVNSTAQVRVNVNFGTPVNNASWYNTDDNYYYLPEQGIYYNPGRRVYVYQENNNWVYGNRLPARYNGYNWNRSHYVRLHEHTPFMHHDEYASHFNRGYRGGHVDYRRDGDRDHQNNGQYNHGNNGNGNGGNHNNEGNGRRPDHQGQDNHNNEGHSRDEHRGRH